MVTLLRVLTSETDGDAVCRSIVESQLAHRDLVSVAIFAGCPDRRALRLIGAHSGPAIPWTYATYDLDVDLPWTTAFRTGRPLVARRDEIADRYPLMAPFADPTWDGIAGELVACLPLFASGTKVGVLHCALRDALEPSWELHEELDLTANAVALWLAALGGIAEGEGSGPAFSITARHRSIIEGIREGRSNAEIAAGIGCSVSTVKATTTALTWFLGATDRRDLAERAEHAGL